LHICVHRNQHFPGRRINAGSHRRGLTVVTAKRHNANAIVELGQFAQNFQTAIRRTVIDINDL
jgi:hypothetical protein